MRYLAPRGGYRRWLDPAHSFTTEADMPDKSSSDHIKARPPLRLVWKVVIAVAVLIAATAGGGIGAAIVRITCESDCALPYAGGTGLGIIFGGMGTLILAVLVARSMQEWRDWSAEQRANESDS
ncbi:MAG: hypothetical protein DCC49_10090 [Acidobacteria bacterium]|nr:MAG: hypothetical protein DCC49_10090 [Acidobacteriota bacterium]